MEYVFFHSSSIIAQLTLTCLKATETLEKDVVDVVLVFLLLALNIFRTLLIRRRSVIKTLSKKWGFFRRYLMALQQISILDI